MTVYMLAVANTLHIVTSHILVRSPMTVYMFVVHNKLHIVTSHILVLSPMTVYMFVVHNKRHIVTSHILVLSPMTVYMFAVANKLHIVTSLYTFTFRFTTPHKSALIQNHTKLHISPHTPSYFAERHYLGHTTLYVWR